MIQFTKEFPIPMQLGRQTSDIAKPKDCQFPLHKLAMAISYTNLPASSVNSTILAKPGGILLLRHKFHHIKMQLQPCYCKSSMIKKHTLRNYLIDSPPLATYG